MSYRASRKKTPTKAIQSVATARTVTIISSLCQPNTVYITVLNDVSWACLHHYKYRGRWFELALGVEFFCWRVHVNDVPLRNYSLTHSLTVDAAEELQRVEYVIYTVLRVRSTSLYDCRQCSIVLKPRSCRIDYSVVCFVTHDCSRMLRKVRPECGLSTERAQSERLAELWECTSAWTPRSISMDLGVHDKCYSRSAARRRSRQWRPVTLSDSYSCAWRLQLWTLLSLRT